MDETQKRSLSELHERLGHNISDKKSLPADNNVFLPDAGDEHNSPDHEQTGSPKPEYRKNTTVGNQLLRNESVITRFRRLSLIGKDDTAREDKSVIGKFRRRTYSVMQSNIETSVDGNNKSSFFGSKMSHENETDSSGKRESLRSSLMTSIKKVKDKLQDRRDDISVFKTYLGPEIVIADEEHQKAEERFNICIQQERIFDSEDGGHHFRIFSYTKYCSIIHNFRRTKMMEQIGKLLYLSSDPLDIFTETKVRLKIQLNMQNPFDDNTSCLVMTLCMDDEPYDVHRENSRERSFGRQWNVKDLIPTSHFYHKRTIKICNNHNRLGERDILFQDEPPFGSKWTQDWLRWCYFEPKFVPYYVLEREPGFLQTSDELEIQVIFEPLFPLVKFYMSNNGILNWTLSDYTLKRQNEKDGLIECSYSPYFYSESRGYRMQVRVYLNGAGIAKGTMVSVFLDFLVGEWDDRLPPTLDSFPHQTTVTICDQSESGSSEKRSLTKTEISRDGCVSDFWYDFAKQSDIREDIHVKRNELLIHVEVKALD